MLNHMQKKKSIIQGTLAKEVKNISQSKHRIRHIEGIAFIL